MERLEQTRRLAHDLIREWREDRVPDLAAQVAFYAVLSLFPAMLAFTASMSALDAIVGADLADRTEARVVEFLTSVLTEDAAETIDAVAEVFTDQRTGLLTISLLAAVWTTTRAFAALIRALDVVYDLDDHRSWLSTRMTAVALALGSVVAGSVMVAVVIVGPLLGTGVELADRFGFGSQFAVLWDLLRLPVAFALLVGFAATIFHVAPDHRTPWRNDLPGALATTVLWVVFSAGLRVYLAAASAGNAVYGTLGGILLVLLWFWLLALAVMIGGQLNATLWQRRSAGDGSAGVQGPAQAGDEVPGVDGRSAVEHEAHDGGGDDDTVRLGRGGHGGGGVGDAEPHGDR